MRIGWFPGVGRRASVARRSMATPSPHGKSGSSQCSGKMSAALYLEAAPSLGGFLHARVSSGGKGEGENEEIEGLVGQRAALSPCVVCERFAPP